MAQIDNLQKFYDANKNRFDSSQTIPNAIADAKYNLEWAETHLPTITKFMKEANSSSKFGAISLLIIVSTLFAYLM